MRRFISLLFVLALISLAGFVGYAYLAELPPPTATIETPAAGVGFGQ
ncbi:MAG: hypothetical protein WD969_10075 [Paracoccaceae bacterium]